MLLRLLDSVHCSLGQGAVPTLEFFYVLRQVAQLALRTSTFKKLSRVARDLPEIGQCDQKTGPSVIERMPAESREKLIRFAVDLMEDWPERFIEALGAADVNRADFFVAKASSPTWFWEVIESNLSKQNCSVTASAIESVI